MSWRQSSHTESSLRADLRLTNKVKGMGIMNAGNAGVPLLERLIRQGLSHQVRW